MDTVVFTLMLQFSEKCWLFLALDSSEIWRWTSWYRNCKCFGDKIFEELPLWWHWKEYVMPSNHSMYSFFFFCSPFPEIERTKGERELFYDNQIQQLWHNFTPHPWIWLKQPSLPQYAFLERRWSPSVSSIPIHMLEYFNLFSPCLLFLHAHLYWYKTFPELNRSYLAFLQIEHARNLISLAQVDVQFRCG